MSGECYSADNLVKEISSSGKGKDRGGGKGTMSSETDSALVLPERMKNSQQGDGEAGDTRLNKLLEYETVVSSAESKCSQLKGHLERIKQLYNNQAELVKSTAVKIQKSSTRQTRSRQDNCPTNQRRSNPKFKAAAAAAGRITRQNSHRIATDTTGAALGTINNILAGITKSIQVSEASKVQTVESKHSTKPEQDKSPPPLPVFGVDDVKIHSKSKPTINEKSKPKMKSVRTARSKVTSKTSSIMLKKTRKSTTKIPDKRSRISDTELVSRPGISEINKQSVMKTERSRFTPRQYGGRPMSGNQDLVEIYHNTAVKECKSSDSDVARKKAAAARPAERGDAQIDKVELVPPLNIDEEKMVETNRVIISCYNKNYAMPTISSRMKQVAKYYMNSFNLKTIPFCPATSTTPSHNIGINIQQVMNMVKIKQPVGQLSPTLAYNIALVAGKWTSNPLSILVSNTTRSIYSQCPLSKTTINYQQMQEMAKTIPEEIIEEVDENNDDANESPDTQSMIITGPSGDVRVTNRKQTVWTASNDDKTCICLPNKGNEIQHIINRFNGAVSKTAVLNNNNNNNNKTATVTAKTTIKEPRSKSTHEPMVTRQASKSTVECTPLQNKERKLKEVLTKLHDEFERMTTRYDKLVEENDSVGESPELNKELEKLDKELNSKEEEIVMVMSLYKEVLALKEQVKVLKDRSSREVVSVKSCSQKGSDMNTAGVLNKLLNRIQHFQTHYKKT